MTGAGKIRTREDPAVRRAQIIGEAIGVIGDHGYNGFTVQALAERCGLSNAGLLHYFGSKDGVLLAILDEIERRETEVIAPLTKRSGHDPHTHMLEVLTRIIERVVQQPEVGRFTSVVQSESINPSHPAHAWFGIRERATLNLFARLVKPLCGEPDSMARRLLATMIGLEQLWFRSGSGFDLAAEWGKAIETLLPAKPSNLRKAA